MHLKTPGKIVLLILIVGLLVGAYRLFGGKGLLEKIAPDKATATSVVPQKAELPNADTGSAGGGAQTASYALPGSEPGCKDLPEVRLLGYAWNAQMGMLFANGGPQATRDSLMCKYGVNFKFERQDDNGKLQEALTAFAQELKNGNPNPEKGAHFVTVMGDGSAAFLKGLNDTLGKLGPAYRAKVVDAIGYSRGEDKFMGPQGWKDNPQAAMGGVVAGVIRDGDWNIAQKWLGDNGLRTNPDEKTYDPDALNWVNANDYIDAGEKYISGYSEDRPVVRNGKKTGETKHITVQGVVTWTPGDVNVAEKKGGIVPIVSTREYSSQMPCVVIGIDKWCRDHRKTVDGLVRAIAEGSDAVKANPAALDRAAAVSAAVYHDQGSDAAYWEKYYKGVTEEDKTGVKVSLGGSSVNNLADTLLTFGLVPGSANLYAVTYKVFGDIAHSQYPDLVPAIDDVSRVLDTSYVQDVAKQVGGTGTGSKTAAAVAHAVPTFTKAQAVKTVVSRRSWNIPFDSGRASFSPAAQKDLERLRRDLLVAQSTVVEVHGHTDNQGDPAKNMQLSEARAFAVASWLHKQFPVNFPEGRVRVFSHGETNPVAPNATPDGRARNRRVEVVIGTAN